MTDSIENPQKIQMPERWPGELKALLVLGLPMGAAQVIQFSIYTVDTVMIGRIGPDALAAAALGTVVYFLLWMLGSGPVMAVSPLVSQALGADMNDRRDARMSVRMAIWLIFLMFPVLLLMVVFTEPLLVTFGQDPVLAQKASEYMLALAPGWPFTLGVMALRNFLASIGKTMVPLVLVSVTVLINAGLNYLLIFGVFGFPRLELIGAGIASSISYFLCFLLFIAYCAVDDEARKFKLFENFWRPHWDRMMEVIKLGWPISITTVFEGMLFNMCVLLMGVIGKMEVAAYQVALNVAALAFMMPFGLSMAGAVRVGLAKGAENSAAVKRAGLVTLFASIAAIMFFAVPIAIWPEAIAPLYLKIDDPNNAQVIALVTAFLPIAAAFMLFDAVQVTANQCLRGLKDVKIPMILTGISYWIIGFPVAWYLGLKTDVAGNGIWYGLLAGLFTASILLGWRFWYLAWKKA